MSKQASNLRKTKKNALDNAAQNIGIKPTAASPAIEETAQPAASTIEEKPIEQAATQPTPAAPIIEPTEPLDEETTAKDKPLKAEWPRINISFSPENYGLIRVLMGKQKATAATVLNKILNEYRENHAELKPFIDFFTYD